MGAQRSPATDPEISLLLASLAEAFDKKSWHGPNLRGSLRGVTAQQAAWRPAEGHHNIWELALHAAYWKYVVRRRITGEKRGSFVLKGSNFFKRPLGPGEDALSEEAWKQDVAILEAEHAALFDVVARIPIVWRRDLIKWRATLFLVRGAAAHDVYHAGQIRLLCALQR